MRYNTVGVFRSNECDRCEGTGKTHRGNLYFECPDCGGRGDTTTPVCEYCFKDCILVPFLRDVDDDRVEWRCPDRENGFACGDGNSKRPSDICPNCLSHSHERGFPNWGTMVCNHCGHEFSSHDGSSED